MLKRLIPFIICFYALTSFAQTGRIENLQIDSAASLHHFIIPKSGTIISAGNYYKDFMHAKTIKLKDLAGTPWPATYEQFKKEFLELEVEDPLANLDLHLPSPEEMRNLAYPQGGIVMPGPISILYDQFSKEARSKEIYAGLIIKDKAATRYNKDVVSRITGITDEDELKKFMEFCALQIQFILESTDYELYAAIMDCYSEFRKSRADTVTPGE